jgi:dihydroorotate dehydrogenase electron transfer subunit
MLAACAKTASRFGRPCQVSVERVMGCGMGGCYRCIIPMRDQDGISHHVRSCLAGPVLAGDKIVWD